MKYIDEDSVIEIISIIWTDELNKWFNNMKQSYDDYYTSHYQYCPKCVLDYYQWFYFETTIYEVGDDWIRKKTQINIF